MNTPSRHLIRPRPTPPEGSGFRRGVLARRDYFAYALRPAPKLPDKPGLWLDNEDCVWIYGENNRLVRLIGSEGWQTCYEGMALGNPILRDCAPFRPAKAVEV